MRADGDDEIAIVVERRGDQRVESRIAEELAPPDVGGARAGRRRVGVSDASYSGGVGSGGCACGGAKWQASAASTAPEREAASDPAADRR